MNISMVNIRCRFISKSPYMKGRKAAKLLDTLMLNTTTHTDKSVSFR